MYIILFSFKKKMEGLMLNEKSQAEKDKYFTVSVMCET